MFEVGDIQRVAVRHHQHITAGRQLRRLIDQFGLMLAGDAVHIASQSRQTIEGLRTAIDPAHLAG